MVRNVVLLLLVVSVAWAEQVGVNDDGQRTNASTWECTSGHKIMTQQISLQNTARQYALKYTGCQEPVHDGEHPASEGNFGMPAPVACNWYHSGFLTMDLNGKDVVRQDLKQFMGIESGERGEVQVVWAHPDAEVGLRFVLRPGSNHLDCLLKWQPRAGKSVNNLTVKLRCYPSFFTSAMRRKGDRHCQTPRTDQQEPTTLTIVPGEDAWLYYYDTVFDVAKGEGDGPCAALLGPQGLQGGRVFIGDYAVNTELNLKPDVGEYRFALYDLSGSKNAEALAYLQAHGTEDLAQLLALDFRPSGVRGLDVARLKADAGQLVTDAADDGVALKPKVDAVLKQVDELAARGQAGDWQAEAELAGVLESSQDLFWRLKTFAILNRK